MRTLLYVTTAFFIFLMGCPEPAVGCIDGTTQSCACSGGRSGVQACTAERRFGACECDPGVEDAGRLDTGVPVDSAETGGGSADAGMMIGTGESVTETVGPEGGEIELSGATVTFPAGAVSTATAITITETTMPTPAGYRAFSPLYRFEPEGLVFASPLTVSIRSRAAGADVPLGTLFWSRPAADGGGWERLGGIPTGDRVTGQVEHFSYGFIADGVDYTEAPDRSCVRTRVLDSRTMAPSGVGLFFAMEDCWGRPITDLSAAEVAVFEDDAMLSSEASASLFEQRGLQVFVTLVIDMSSSTAPVLTQVLAAARELVQTLNEPTRGLRDRVQVGISVFAGERTLTTWQTHSLDLDAVLGRIDELATFAAGDPASTNLHGALVAALSSSASAQAAFEERNVGGAFAAGYVVLFTDGTDTSGLVDRAAATAAVASSSDDVIAVGLRGLDYDPTALRALAGDFGVIDSPDPATLSRDFARVAARIAGQVRRTYLLGYCSPKRSGSHTVAVGIRGSTRTAWGADPTFSATGFGPGCAPAMFDPTVVCGASECGGFGCGACDDRSSICGARGTCTSYCEVDRVCGGAAHVNRRGYSQSCLDTSSNSTCGSACVDLDNDEQNCGACGQTCAFGCQAGACLPASLEPHRRPWRYPIFVSSLGWLVEHDQYHVMPRNDDGTFVVRPDEIRVLTEANYALVLVLNDGRLLYWADRGNDTSRAIRGIPLPTGTVATDAIQANTGDLLVRLEDGRVVSARLPLSDAPVWLDRLTGINTLSQFDLFLDDAGNLVTWGNVAVFSPPAGSALSWSGSNCWNLAEGPLQRLYCYVDDAPRDFGTYPGELLYGYATVHSTLAPRSYKVQTRSLSGTVVSYGFRLVGGSASSYTSTVTVDTGADRVLGDGRTLVAPGNARFGELQGECNPGGCSSIGRVDYPVGDVPIPQELGGFCSATIACGPDLWCMERECVRCSTPTESAGAGCGARSGH